MTQADAKKNSERAAYMKKHKITRKTGQCPMGCGAAIPNGGSALLNHFNVCGKRR
jgi:hypothetical protein